MRTARGNELESIYGAGKKKHRLGGGVVRDTMEKKRDSACMGSSPCRAYDSFLSSAGRARAAPLTSCGNLDSIQRIRTKG